MGWCSKEAKERVGTLPDAKAAEEAALALYDERKRISAQLKELEDELACRVDDTHAILEQYPGTKFYRTTRS